MRYIKKGTAPDSLIQYAKNENAYFDGCNKDDIREKLLEDQGFLCAYCMRRLHSTKDVKIEHMLPQSILRDNPKRALDYKIMAGVCYGNEQKGECGKKRSKKELTCDAHKGNTVLEVVNPFDETCIQKIKYEADGRITSDDEKLERDLNVILNLNYDGDGVYLMQNRKEVLRACKEKIKRMKERGQWSRALLQKVLKEYEERDKEGYLKPYSGIAIWYLKKRIYKS